MKQLIILFLLFQIFIKPQGGEKTPDPNLFSKQELERTIKFLGSDSLSGRGTGSEEEETAANFIAEELSNVNITPIGIANSFFQHIPLLGNIPLANSDLVLYTGSKEYELKLNDDYLMYTTGEQTFIPNPVPLVFVGYGIIAPEFDYNDYQSVDVEGKIAVMLSGEPASDDPNYFFGDAGTIYSTPEAKQRLAISRGASGSIIIPYRKNWNNKLWENYKKQFAFENVILPYNAADNLSLLFNPSQVSKLFINSGYTLKDIYESEKNGSIKSFPLNIELSFAGSFKEREFISKNVVGMIEGNDPDLKDTYLILSAHYDHLGIGPAIKGDSIYNGVLDNAMGVAALLQLTKALKINEKKLKRSVIILFLTGEEKGLIGSNYYVDHPLVPLYKTIADINIDGVAVFDEFNSIVGVGREFSTLNNYFKSTAVELSLNVTKIPEEFNQTDAFYRSDQLAFAMAGIPSILTMDGIDYKHLSKEEGKEMFINYSENIYHTPFDDLKQKINYDAAVQHITFIYQMSLNLLNSNKTPEWNEDAPFINARLRSIAEKR